MGEEGTRKAIGCQHRGMNLLGEPIAAKGKVAKKYTEDGEHYVECEVWTETAEGKITAPGSATVILPSKG